MLEMYEGVKIRTVVRHSIHKNKDKIAYSFWLCPPMSRTNIYRLDPGAPQIWVSGYEV